MRYSINNQNGYALFIALLATLLIAILGVSMITLSTNTMNFSASERGNQSSFYIAEAGLIEKRAELQTVVQQAFDTTQDTFDNIDEPEEKAAFNFEEEFYANVQQQVNATLPFQSTQSYEAQQGQIPTSETLVTLQSEEPLVYRIASTGSVSLSSGREQTKALSQLLEVQLAVNQEPKTVIIPGESVVKLRACFSLYTQADLYHKTNSLAGPIFVNGITYIERGGSFINGNVYSAGNVNITGGGSGINGDVYTAGRVSITGGGSRVNGSIYQNVNLSQVQNECLQEIPTLPDVATMFPDTSASQADNHSNSTGVPVIQNGVLSLNNYQLANYTYTLNRDMSLQRLHIPSNRSLTFDLQNQDRTLFVDNLDIQNGSIHLLNADNHTLKLIVQDRFVYGNGDLNRNGATDSLEVYYAGSTPPQLGGNSIYNATFHIKQADLEVGGSNGLKGDLIHYGTNSSITVSGSGNLGNRLILAPNSNFFLTGSGNITGNIIAKNFTASGSGSISPPTSDSGEWEYSDSNEQVIEYTEYQDEGSLLKASPLEED